MNLAVESPPPERKPTLREHCCVEEADILFAGQRNKRRLVDSLGASSRGGLEIPSSSSQPWSGGRSSRRDCVDFSPSENLHVNSGGHLHGVVPVQKRTRYQQQQEYQGGSFFQGQESLDRGVRRAVVQETLYKALRALFPGMSDETIARVLEACGDDVDAAIRRLNELQLGGSGEEEEGRGVEGDIKEGFVEKGGEGVERGTTSTRVVKAAWVEALVSEMSQASDLDDAKRRAGGVLERVLEDHDGCGAGVSNRGQLERENALLKRAVGIQNSKIHELGEKCKGVDELVGKFQEMKDRCQALEMHNYSLQVHLKQATSALSRQGGVEYGNSGQNGGRNPDVY